MTVQNQNQPNKKLSLVEQVMEKIRQRISNQRLAPGTKLPSIRKSAIQLAVSKSTMVTAYDRLAATGEIKAIRGSGFFVAGNLVPLNLIETGPDIDHDVDPLWVSRQSLQADENTLKPGCGWLPPDWMPHDNIRRSLRSLSRADPAILTDYGTPKGFAPLREHLLRRMGEHRIEASLDQVMLTSSGTHALELLCRFFLEPGDTVLVDDPCYFNFHALLKAHRVKVVSVPITQNGPDMKKFEQVLLEHQPRLYITNSAIHNPTGAILTPAKAHKILNLAEKSDLIIIEDDIFGDMEILPAPRLAALDGLNRVIHIGSFSKTLSAAIRCGFIATKKRWIEPLTDLKIATSFGGEPFGAEVTWRVLKDGSYRKHLNELRQRLSRAMGKTSSRLNKIGIKPWSDTKFGMYLWSELPQGFDAIEVARKARSMGVILAPGNVFSLNNSANRFLRFNVAQSSSPKIYEVLQAIISEQG